MKRQKLFFSKEIKASKEKVWDVLLQDETYRIWTSVFTQGSYAETDWEEGSKVLFKSPEGYGLSSKIIKHKPNEIIIIEHLGILENNKEDFDGTEAQKWKGLFETYKISEKDGISTLIVDQDISTEYADQFKKPWEEGLKKIKELAENH